MGGSGESLIRRTRNRSNPTTRSRYTARVNLSEESGS